MSAWSLAFQVINFLVLAAILRRFLFKPVSAMVARRQDEIERARSDAERVGREAEELRTGAERAAAETVTERDRMLEEARRRIEREREEGLAMARQQAAALVDGARQEIESERERAAEGVSAEAVDLGTAIARRLLEQVRTAGIAEAFLERLCERLDELPTDRKASLRTELADEELLVATAPGLGPEAQGRWLADIAKRLGNEVRVRCIRDDALVAGAELRFLHTTLSFSWRDALQAASVELLRHGDDR